MVTYGIDRIKDYLSWISNSRVGLLTSISGRDSQNQSSVSVLNEVCRLTALFGPEHGVRGDMAAGALFEDYTDSATGLPVFSLYSAAGRRLSPEMLSQIDILVYDIQDVGTRFYTFLSTLRNVMEDCAKAGKRVVVLDRPNPLGDTVEGGILDMKYSSFVGCHTIPFRYGLTAGEAAMMFNAELGFNCDLKVVPCGGWDRKSLFSDWGKIWPAPSLGLPTFETTLLYPGTCLIEGTNLSEGRGTSAPFRIIGAPFVDSEALCAEFNQAGLAGLTSTPTWFSPTTSKHQGVHCGGILLHVTEPHALRPVTVGITLLDLLQKMYPNDFAYLPPVKESGRQFITLLSGGSELIEPWDKDELLKKYETDSEAFAERKKQFHIY